MKKQPIKNEYPRESAGRKMIFDVPTCSPSDTVFKVKKSILEKAGDFETINYVYVVESLKLVGVFSLKEIFRRKESEAVASFMIEDVIKIRPRSDQEKVASLAIKHNLKAIPVADKNGRFLGVVPSDVILGILHEEHIEDALLSAGINKRNDFSAKILTAPANVLAKVRLPWLIVGLMGGVLAAQITVIFEEPLKTHFILAAFIPLIVYIADAVGTQTQTLYIRSLAVNNFSQKDYFLREAKISIFIALILALILVVVSFFISKTPLVALIMGISLFLTVMTAMAISILIAWSLFKMGKDPALGSGPLGTIVADISSLLIYFFVAALLLNAI